MTLSPEEIQQYATEGYLIPTVNLDEGEVTKLRAALDQVIADNPNIRPEKLVSAHISRGNSHEGVKGCEEFLNLAKNPKLLDVVEQLIGPNIILWGCQLFCKPAGDGMEVPLHQDGHYWPIRPLATCTVWVAIDDSNKENGCLQVVPRTHEGQKLLEHKKDDREGLVLNQAVLEHQFDKTALTDVELKAGQFSLHDVYLVHGSNPNKSANRRAGVALRYMPASSHFDRELNPQTNAGYAVDFANRPLWLLRGVDECGKNDFNRGHPQ
eukprot:TRINITY_DN67775_c8_g1_i1.p1 TRINITY_DN67775_c8_g1~~TRINITY_DN67775_c8_g1_i1.p1  ORF type:complete len:276 (-),score=17.83 TRINITY_DN67775_c8_g1_i1:205-1005(-)